VDSVSIEPDHAGFDRLARVLEVESSGDEWRADLATDLHAALKPGVAAVRSALLGMSSGGLEHAGEPLRATVASSVESDIRIEGDMAGARIRARKTFGLRGFVNAPKRLNAKSWRHPTRGGHAWVTQVGQPGWFDDTLRRLAPVLHQAAQHALQNRADRISRKAPG
jgi:hypothetical protein